MRAGLAGRTLVLETMSSDDGRHRRPLPGSMTRRSVMRSSWHPLARCAGLLALALLSAGPAAASWPMDPGSNLLIHAESCTERAWDCVSDGAGGMLVTIESTGVPYLQQVNRLGNGIWGGPGVRLSPSAIVPYGWPRALADSMGGAFVVWADGTGAHAQYVTRYAATPWGTAGVLLGPVTEGGAECAITTDAAAGAIVVWAPHTPGRLLAQRLADYDGSPLWPDGPVTVSTDLSWTKLGLSAVPDGAGGVIVTWRTGNAEGANWRAMSQRISADGTVLWAPQGVALCSSPGLEYDPKSISDGAGGAIVTWYEVVSGVPNIRAQRISAAGELLWGPAGIVLCNATGDRYGPVLVSDRAGGAIVAWYEQRGGDCNVFAQRLSPTGARLWPADGVTLCAALGVQQRAAIVPDGAGGAIVAWEDLRATELTRGDVFAQRVDPAGNVKWATDGVPVSTMRYDQLFVVATEDGHGGALLAWATGVQGVTCTYIYAQRLDGMGVLSDYTPVPVLASFLGADIEDGAVAVAWWLGGREGATAGIERAVSPGTWTHIGEARVDGSGYLRYRDESLPAADRLGYRIALAGGEALGEAWVELPARGFALEPLRPNPVTGRTATLRFTLPRSAPARIEVTDPAGRLVSRREVGAAGPGAHSIELARMQPGLYLVTLRQGKESRTRRMVVLR
jgi:hypothetical protein